MSRTIILILCMLATSLKCESQEMNIGLATGLVDDFQFQNPGLKINALYEIIPNHAFPNHAFISFQTNPGIIIIDNQNKPKVIGAFPISMHFNFGNKFRVCPNIGGFYWTVRRWGLTAGMNLEYLIAERFIVFVRAQYLHIFYKQYYPSHFAGGTYQTASALGLNLSVGLKYRIKKRKHITSPTPNTD